MCAEATVEARCPGSLLLVVKVEVNSKELESFSKNQSSYSTPNSYQVFMLQYCHSAVLRYPGTGIMVLAIKCTTSTVRRKHQRVYRTTAQRTLNGKEQAFILEPSTTPLMTTLALVH